jgi:hypothetical protein
MIVEFVFSYELVPQVLFMLITDGSDAECDSQAVHCYGQVSNSHQGLHKIM